MTDKLQLAEELARRGEIRAAIELLETDVSSTGPTSERSLSAHGMLGDLYSEVHDVDRAVAHFAAIIELKPSMALAHFRKGLALKQRLTREFQESAIAAFQESCRLGHSELDARSNIAFCCKILADFGLVAGRRGLSDWRRRGQTSDSSEKTRTVRVRRLRWSVPTSGSRRDCGSFHPKPAAAPTL